jgi:NitT/TauT family transport system permease protein
MAKDKGVKAVLEKTESNNLPMRFYRKSVAIGILLIAWLVLPLLIKSIYVPSLFNVLAEFWRLLSTGVLWPHIASSLRLSIIGLIIGEAIAIPLGTLIGWHERAEKYLDPLFQVMRNTPILALLPLFVIFLGVGDLSKISIITWATFFPTLINTIQGVKNVDNTLLRSAQSMGINTISLFFKVILPAASPFILAGLRLSASISLLVIMAAEMVGARAGIGFFIFNAQNSFQVLRMYVGILTVVIIGVLVNFLLVKLEKRLTRWQERRVN